MLRLLRHLLAIAILPFSVTVLVPAWLARRNGTALGPGATPPALLAQAAGGALLVIGLVLFVASLRRFDREGAGTLAPWDPPRRLVVRGPYAYVRHPIYASILYFTWAGALDNFSLPACAWAALLTAGAVARMLMEEHLLTARYPAYADYQRRVRRVLPFVI